MSDAHWFTSVDGPELRQGDIVLACQVFSVAPVPVPTPVDFVPDADEESHHLIVLTQSCDLANAKVDQVLAAKVVFWSDLVRENETKNPFVKSEKYRTQLVAGTIPGYSLLGRHDGEPTLPWSVVDFHRLYVLPKPYLSAQATARSPRLRLRSPYLEHLSQSFARYFMRVGLPLPLNDFIKGGK